MPVSNKGVRCDGTRMKNDDNICKFNESCARGLKYVLLASETRARATKSDNPPRCRIK